MVGYLIYEVTDHAVNMERYMFPKNNTIILDPYFKFTQPGGCILNHSHLAAGHKMLMMS